MRVISTLLLIPTLFACGAPTKSAGDVAHLFSGTATSLQEKVGGICGVLGSRNTSPNLGEVAFVEGCGDAGLAALNYRDITQFQFLGLEGDVPDKEKKKVIQKTVRGQLWLNKDLLGLATALANKLKTSSNTPGLVNVQDSGKQLENIIKMNIEQKQPFKFDAEKFELGAVIGIKASGIVELDNELQIAGKMIDGAFAVTIRTTGDQVLEKSLIKNISGLVLVVPHAGDVYLDMFLDLQVHNIGLSSLFREMIGGLLSDGMKKAADSLLAL